MLEIVLKLKQLPDKNIQHLREPYRLLKRARQSGDGQLSLPRAMKALGLASSTNTPEEVASLLEEMVEEDIIDIEYNS